MKRLTFTALTIAAFLTSCGESPKKETTEKATTGATTTETTAEITTEDETVVAESSVSGEDLFASNGCVACHQVDTKTVGPSVKEISTAYSGNKEGLNDFFMGTGAAIVDPAQEAVMKPQTEVTKAMSDEERSALADYILNN